ncbi:carotenoid 1,2-hydratase [Candidatus Poribacteria bacterium]|nr:carotenoid 1,2-hydratase [Candidatus Poribacteria bacterium]MBT5711869.1 carotenoid 1,2-hydratase [Candidatus Poribacteria bacterium]MBT7097924.1 carotenoid 1,2-hydratase [Candidatus Poribacteria bacterium]MBT7805549.1 carotenoid 1,2-hydratase [Candidatus Poribacteria bacterium]
MRYRVFASLLAAVVAAVGAALYARSRADPLPDRAPLSLQAFLASDGVEGFARAESPIAFEFPRDHGPHPTYRIEWWYFTGHIESEAGRRFGYQLTFFRRALAPVTADRASAWAANQVYMAHFAITDGAAGTHESAERLSRAAVGLAGAVGEPFRVWVDGWSAESTGAPTFPMRLRAGDEGVSMDLVLDRPKHIVRHGDDGLSVKTTDGSAASYYYSITRVNTSGEIDVNGSRHAVTGSSWIDREWSTSVLDAQHVGWDWFSVQLNDGAELMCFRMRHADGPGASYVTGTYVDAGGSARAVDGAAIEINAVGSWKSPRDGAIYPSGWRLSLAREGISLDLAPLVKDQEMNLSFRYWEGAVCATGNRGGAPLSGHGYVELTGYGAPQAATAKP